MMYLRIIGTIFSLIMFVMLYISNEKILPLNVLAALQAGELRLAYHLVASKELPTVYKGKYGKMLVEGDFLSQDTSKGIKLLIEASEKCDPTSSRLLGLIFFRGDDNQVQDFAHAFRLLKKAAKHGDTIAMNHIAWMYSNGIGIDRNLSKSIFWYSVSSLRGSKEAWYELDFHKTFFNENELHITLSQASRWQPTKDC